MNSCCFVCFNQIKRDKLGTKKEERIEEVIDKRSSKWNKHIHTHTQKFIIQNHSGKAIQADSIQFKCLFKQKCSVLFHLRKVSTDSFIQAELQMMLIIKTICTYVHTIYAQAISYYPEYVCCKIVHHI